MTDLEAYDRCLIAGRFKKLSWGNLNMTPLDGASETFLQWAQMGRPEKANWVWICIDALRRVGSKPGRPRNLLRRNTVSYSQPRPTEWVQSFNESISHTEDNDTNLEVEGLRKFSRGRYRDLIDAYLAHAEDDQPQREMGKELGVSQPRVSQRLNELRERVA